MSLMLIIANNETNETIKFDKKTLKIYIKGYK